MNSIIHINLKKFHHRKHNTYISQTKLRHNKVKAQDYRGSRSLKELLKMALITDHGNGLSVHYILYKLYGEHLNDIIDILYVSCS